MTPSLVPLRVTGAVADSAGGGADPTVVVVVVSGGCGADALDSAGGGAGAVTVDPNVVAIGGGTRCLTVSSLKAVFIRDAVPRSEGLQHQWTTIGDGNV